MTSDRQYRKGLSFEQAINEIIKNYDLQFDGEIARKFVDIIQKQRKTVESELNYQFY